MLQKLNWTQEEPEHKPKMLKKSFLIVLLLVLCAVIQGLPTSNNRGRCLCRGTGYLPSVNPRRIAGVQYHRPSSSCDQEELVVTFKRNGQKRCLNLSLNQGKIIKEAIMKKNSITENH